MLLLQQENLPTYQTEVGASAADITAVTNDAANLQYLLEYTALIEANKKTVNQIKDAVYEGNPDEAVSPFPIFSPAAPPFPLASGIEKRARQRNARFKTAAGYSEEIGKALGIITGAGEAPSTDDLTAALKLTDLGGYQYSMDFRKQGMDAMFTQQRVKGTEKWFDATTALVSPAVVTVDAPATDGAAVQLEIRGRLMKGNQLVGNWSPIYPLTVNP